jgi:transcriptional regulator with XRE-family HTH domain
MAGMKIEDVTPVWVRARMKALGMKQARVAAEAGMTQDKLSKSLTGKRQFTVGERDSLARLLCEPEPPELAPEILDRARRVALLSPERRQLLDALLETLEAQQAESPANRLGSEEP